MSELREPLVRAEKALAEERLDDSDREALDRLVISHLTNLLRTRADRVVPGDPVAQLQAEINKLRTQVAELAAQAEQLRKEKADLERERDQYLRSLYVLLPKPEVAFTEQELRDLERNGVTFDQVLEDLANLQGA